MSLSITSKLAVLLLILMSLNAPGQAQQPAPASNREDSKPKAITGKVVNESGQPIQEALVQVSAPGSGVGVPPVRTDRDGAFRLDGLQSIPYSIAATVPGYTPQPRETAAPPQYRAGDSVTIVMIKGGVITGTVTGTNGQPVVAIGVSARLVRDRNGPRRMPVPTREGVTDDRGVYRIYGLPAGVYIVVADGANDHSRSGINPFSGEVPTYAPSSTRDTAAEITVRSGEEMSNIDIRYRGERGRTISGTIAESSSAENGFVAVLEAVSIGQQWNAAPQPDGRGFLFDGIEDGDYYLTIMSYLKDGDRALSESKLVNVRGADVSGLEFTIQPLAYITGRIVVEDTKAVECTEKTAPPFTEMSVSVWHKDTEAARNRGQFVWNLGVPVTPDAQGNFRLRQLAPSQYYFQSRVAGKTTYLKSITFGSPRPSDVTRVWTNVKSGDRLSGLTVTLAQGAASFSGKLALAEGETTPEKLFVFLVPVEAERADEPLRFYGAGVSNEGKVALNNLAPGRYWVLMQPMVEETPSPLVKVRLPDATRTRASLRREAEAAKMEIELKACQQIADFELPK